MKDLICLLLFSAVYVFASTSESAETVIFSEDTFVELAFSPEADTLLIAGSMIESQKHFFPDTQIQDYFLCGNKLNFVIDDEEMSREEAMERIHWQSTSIFETDPSKTIYLNLVVPENDFIHLKASAFSLKELPGKHKVKKILVEYLGDETFMGSFPFDFSWLSNLKDILVDDGEIFVEMRWMKQYLPVPAITLNTVQSVLKQNFESEFPNFTKVYPFLNLEMFHELTSFVYKRFKQLAVVGINVNIEDCKNIVYSLYPTLYAELNMGHPETFLPKAMKDAFRVNGFVYEGYECYLPHSSDHIPGRKYPVAVFRARKPVSE